MGLDGRYTFNAGIEAGFLTMRRHGILGFTQGKGSKPDRYITAMSSSIYPCLVSNGVFHSRVLKFGAFSFFFPSWFEEKDQKVGYAKGMKRSVLSLYIRKAGMSEDQEATITFRGVEVLSVDTFDAAAYTSAHAKYTAIGMGFKSVTGFTDNVPQALL